MDKVPVDCRPRPPFLCQAPHPAPRSSSAVFLSLCATNALSLLVARARSRNPGMFLLTRWSEKGTTKSLFSAGPHLGFTIGQTKCTTDRFCLLLISPLSIKLRTIPHHCWSEPASSCLSLCGFLICSCLSFFPSTSCLLRGPGPSFCKITI